MGEVEASNMGSLIILHTQEIANLILDMKEFKSLKARFRSSALSAALGNAVSNPIHRFRNV